MVDYSIQALPVTGGQKFECTRCAARRSNQPFALRIFANGFEQAEKRLLHARDPSGPAALNLADSTFSRLQLSFGFGISVPHWINLPRLHAASRSGVMSAHRSTGILPVGQTRVSPDYEFFSAGKMPTGPTAKMAVLLIQPALRIFLVVQRDSLLGELERVLRIEHY